MCEGGKLCNIAGAVLQPPLPPMPLILLPLVGGFREASLQYLHRAPTLHPTALIDNPSCACMYQDCNIIQQRSFIIIVFVGMSPSNSWAATITFALPQIC